MIRTRRSEPLDGDPNAFHHSTSVKHDDYGPVESWHKEVEGQAIEFVQFKQDID